MDYSQRKSLEIQIQEFGQIPTQLFKTAHLPKANRIDDSDYLTISSTTPPLLSSQMSSIQSNSNADASLFGNSQVLQSLATVSVSSSPYRICASSFASLEIKLCVKMHKSQVNDLIFIEEHVPSKVCFLSL